MLAVLKICCCLVAKLYSTLCNPMDYSLPGSSVHRILLARILEWVAISLSRGSSPPRMEPASPALTGGCITGKFFTAEPSGKPWVKDAWHQKSIKLAVVLLMAQETLQSDNQHGLLQESIGEPGASGLRIEQAPVSVPAKSEVT